MVFLSKLCLKTVSQNCINENVSIAGSFQMTEIFLIAVYSITVKMSNAVSVSISWLVVDRRDGLQRVAGDRYALQDRSNGRVAEHLKETLFSFGSDVIQYGLDSRVHAAAASSVL